jgi:hypothetical protein
LENETAVFPGIGKSRGFFSKAWKTRRSGSVFQFFQARQVQLTDFNTH